MTHHALPHTATRRHALNASGISTPQAVCCLSLLLFLLLNLATYHYLLLFLAATPLLALLVLTLAISHPTNFPSCVTATSFVRLCTTFTAAWLGCLAALCRFVAVKWDVFGGALSDNCSRAG